MISAAENHVVPWISLSLLSIRGYTVVRTRMVGTAIVMAAWVPHNSCLFTRFLMHNYYVTEIIMCREHAGVSLFLVDAGHNNIDYVRAIATSNVVRISIRDTDACMYRCTHNYKGRKETRLKSLSREIITSTALFTRLMPRCTQERVNQARGYTRHPEPRVPRADHSQSPSEPERGYANGGTHRDEGRSFTRYIGTLYTIRVRMTVV